MANYTVIYPENTGTPGSESSYKNWTLRINYEENITIPTNSSTFIFHTPDIYAKYSASDTKRPYCRARVSAGIKIGDTDLGIWEFDSLYVEERSIAGYFQWRNFNKTDIDPWKGINNNTEFKLTKYSYNPSGENCLLHEGILNTANYFDRSNSTSKTLPIVLFSNYNEDGENYGRIYFGSKKNSTVGDSTNRCYYANNNFTNISIGNLVLDAPPIINSSSLTTSHSSGYPTSYCSTNKSTVSCSFNIAAQYGGNIKQIDFVLGDQYYRQTFNNNTTSYNSTFNIVPDKKGTFTP